MSLNTQLLFAERHVLCKFTFRCKQSFHSGTVQEDLNRHGYSQPSLMLAIEK